uniref:Uncharacterized protein n=1 Tax=viral metagenome TaxID=1070528 RepID=A0A6C0KK74_9ZZZZ
MRKRQTRRNTNNSRKRARKTIKKKGGTVLTPRQANSENISIDTISDFKEFIKKIKPNDHDNVIGNFIYFVKSNVETYSKQKDSVYRMLQRIFDVQLNLPNTVLGSGHRDNRQQKRINGIRLNYNSETEVENNSNSEK